MLSQALEVCMACSAVWASLSGHTRALYAASLLALAHFPLTDVYKRWPSLPVIPSLALTALYASDTHQALSWPAALALRLPAVLLSSISLLGSLAFPQPEFMRLRGRYKHVGFVDTVIPHSSDGTATSSAASADATCAGAGTPAPKGVIARILYPGLPGTGRRVPYMMGGRGQTRAIHRFGAPPFLKPFDALHVHWLLLSPPIHMDALPLVLHNDSPSHSATESHNNGGSSGRQLNEEEKQHSPGPLKFPVVVFSHGNGGSREIYTTICAEIASQGYIVVALEHLDGSAAMARLPDGSCRVYNPEQYKFDKANEHLYVWDRREQIEKRVAETLDALRFVRNLAKSSPEGSSPDKPQSPPILPNAPVDLQAIMDVSKVGLMGHSYGAATVLAASARSPELVSTCIALDPAVDWTCEDTLRYLVGNFTAVTRCRHSEAEKPISRGLKSVPTLFLYSGSWIHLNWGSPMFMNARLQEGAFAPGSCFCAVERSGHVSFADNLLLLPHWLSRSLKLTGNATPQESLSVITSVISQYLEDRFHGKKNAIPSISKDVVRFIEYLPQKHE